MVRKARSSLQPGVGGGMPTPTPKIKIEFQRGSRGPLAKDAQMREAVLLVLCNPLDSSRSWLDLPQFAQ
jgi:hypothetical protein